MINYKTYKINDYYIDFCILTLSNDSKDFVVVALKNFKQIGYCHFVLENNECKLSRIAITKKDYLGMGIGSIMFSCMETFAHSRNVNYLTGIFIPRGYDNAWDITAKFYQRQNMTTSNCDYDYFERDEISKQIKVEDNHFLLPLSVSNRLYQKVIDYNYMTHDIFSSSHRDDNSNLEL